MHASTLRRAVTHALVMTILSSTAMTAGYTAPALAVEEATTSGAVISHKPHNISPQIKGHAELMVHTMQSVSGDRTTASTLLFVPDGKRHTGDGQ